MATAEGSGDWGLVRLVTGAVDTARRGGFAWLAVGAAMALSLIGIYSIDVATQLEPTGLQELSGPALRQLIYLAVGLIACITVAIPNYRVYGYASGVLFAIGVVLLIFLLIPFVPTSIVRPRNGARAWIDLGPMDFQPSEVAKIGYVLLLAWYLRFRKNHRTIGGLLPPAIITGIPVALITLQPDLGQAALFIPALFAVLVAAGAKLKHLTVIVLIATMAAPAAYPILKPHQKERFVGLIKQFTGDESSSQDINFQSVGAQRLAGAGGVEGVGDEHARVLLHFNALPERHNDMIYAVIVNRFGLVGGLAVLGLYLVWFIGALGTAAACREPFGRLICVGLTGFIAAQVAINVGMNLGLAPIIGITLPFVSNGGSSMVTVWIMCGLILNVALHRPSYSLRKSFEYGDDE